MFDPHPLAKDVPDMTEEEYTALVEDIALHGLRQPITIYQGMILDGRHRYNALRELGERGHKLNLTDGIFTAFEGTDEEAAAYVNSLNYRRRHLEYTVHACKAVHWIEQQKAAGEFKQGRPDKGGPRATFSGKAVEVAAVREGVGSRFVREALEVKAKAPDLFEQMEQRGMTVYEAQRVVKEREREARREANRQAIAEAAPIPAHTRFSTIVIDPPWDWGDEGDCDQFGRARPTYETMPFEKIATLPIGELAAKDVHLYLWITNRSLPKGFELLTAWGFRYITCLTWCKPSIGMGNYFRGSTEHVLFGIRGSLPLLRNDAGTWFTAPRPGEHSEKPDTFYELIETCSPGPWLEMFARKERPGWRVWGGEVD